MSSYILKEEQWEYLKTRIKILIEKNKSYETCEKEYLKLIESMRCETKDLRRQIEDLEEEIIYLKEDNEYLEGQVGFYCDMYNNLLMEDDEWN